MEQDKVTITGATGFVGSHLVESALEHDLNVQVITRPIEDLSYLPLEKIHNEAIGLESIDDLIRAFEGSEYLIHNAGVINAKDPNVYWQVNVELTRNVLKAAREVKSFKQIIVTSSFASVGPTPTGVLPDESYRYAPREPYGESKRDMEIMVQDEFSDLPIIIMRPASVYGERERDLMAMFQMFERQLSFKLGLGLKEFSMIYVKDLANLFIEALVSQEGQEIFNIANPTPHTWEELTKAGEEVLSKRIRIISIPAIPLKLAGRILSGAESLLNKTLMFNYHRAVRVTEPSYTCDTSKIFSRFGNIKLHTLSEGFNKTVGWYREMGYMKK